MTIQVLLGVEDKAVADHLTAQFGELPDVTVAAVQSSSVDVVHAMEALPGIETVLVHQGLGPQPALDLVREIVIRHPQLAVVLIAETATAETYAAAMAAGARGVISSEPTLSELHTRVRQAAEWSRSMRRHFNSAEAEPASGRLGTLLTLCGGKGGTGTTTLAVHLAVATAASGRTVCLVDMDLQKGDVGGYLDVRHRHSIADLAAAGDDLDGTTAAEALYVHPDGPHLLLAPGAGELAEDVSSRAARQILTLLRSRYDVVIVDSGAHVADANAVAVETADRVVVTVTPDLPALQGAKRLIRLWDRLGIRKPEDVSVLPVRHDRRNEIQPDLMRKMLGSPLLDAAVPAAFRSLEEAVNTGRPTAVKSTEFRRAVARVGRELDLLGSPAGVAARDRGAMSVEFGALIPFIGFLVLFAWQTAMIGLTSMHASHAANEAARAVSVLGYDTRDTEQARANRAEVRRRTVERIAGPWGDERHLRITVKDGYATVRIATPVLLPGWRGPFDVSGTAKVVDEGESDSAGEG